MHSTQLGQYTVWFSQSEEFHTLKREIFTHNDYYLEFDHQNPVIIDAGAHIGLTTLYFKRLYPSAKIWAVEPQPENYSLLKKNCTENLLEDVITLHAALTEGGTTTQLHHDATQIHWNSTASRFAHAWNGQQTTETIEVPALQLSKLIQTIIHQPIDLLKMDIEGSETAVLHEAARFLHSISNMIIEFHPRARHSYESIEKLLSSKGFSVEYWRHGQEVEPRKTKGLFYIQAQKRK
jgi:FkbM family methyltransferase